MAKVREDRAVVRVANAKKAVEKGIKAWVPTAKELADAEQFAARGLTDAQVCGAMGFLPGTAELRRQYHEDWANAIDIGRAKGVSLVADALMKQAINGNTQAAKFWLQAVAKWSETTEVHHTGETTQVVRVEAPPMLSPEQWQRAVAKQEEEAIKALEDQQAVVDATVIDGSEEEETNDG